MKIDILTNAQAEPNGSFTGVTSKTIWGDSFRIGVGGAELGLLTMCEEWHKIGYDVTLYNNPWDAGGSLFKQKFVHEFDPSADRDVLINFRSPVIQSVPAKGLKVWFSTDQFSVGDYAKFSKFVDKIVCISSHHSEYFAHAYGIENCIVIDLPVRADDFQSKAHKIPHRFIFSSVPERGLANLWRMWPKIKKGIPDASLVITSDYRLWGTSSLNERHRVMWMDRKDFEFLGAVNRKRYIEELQKAEIFFYPCNYEELFCIYGNNLVRTVGGMKLIHNLNVGDYILTGSGNFSKINNKYVWVSKNDKYKIKTFGNSESLDVTGNHKLLAIRNRCCSFEPINKKYKIKSKSCVPEWIDAKDLKVGDILLSSFPVDEIDKSYIFLSSYVKNLEVIGDKLYQLHSHARHGVTRKKTGLQDLIVISSSFLRLLGYYIAEGSTSDGTIQFTIHEDELDTIGKDIINCVKVVFDLDIKYLKRKHARAIQLWASSTPLARFFESLCGKLSRGKHIPEWAMALPKDKQKEILISMIKGDGHIILPKDSKNTMSIVYTTASYSLAYQVRDILARMEICSSIRLRKASNTYVVVCSGNQISGLLKEFGHTFVPSRKSSKKMWIHDGYIHMPILDIKTSQSSEAIYDFTVDGDDPSLVVNGKIIHNCISCAEAQYAGLIPVTSNIGALSTTNMGYKVELDADKSINDDAFVAKLMIAVLDPEYKKLGKEFVEKAKERFSPEKILQEWETKVFK